MLTDSIIPKDKTSNNVTITIMDSSARPGDREILKQKIRIADSIIAVFDTTRPETLDSLIKDWLPLIRSMCSAESSTSPKKNGGGGTSVQGNGAATTATSSGSSNSSSGGGGSSSSIIGSSDNSSGSSTSSSGSSDSSGSSSSGNGGISLASGSAQLSLASAPSRSGGTTAGNHLSDLVLHKKTVFVVGTKKELLGDVENEQREQEEIIKMRGITRDFAFVEGYERCSSKTLENVDDVFYNAETAVTFPLGPLYDSDSGSLTPTCKRAFCRIFRAADVDRDNLLSDQELIMLQVKAFGDPLERDQVVNVKKQIKILCKVNGRGVGICDNKITLDGFLAYIELYIEKFRPQVPWIILKRFGYNDALHLQVPAELTRLPPGIKLYHDQHVTELSPEALLFLRDLALAATHSSRPNSSVSSVQLVGKQYDASKALTLEALATIMSVLEAGSGHPWHAPPLFLPQSLGESENLMILGGYIPSDDGHAPCITIAQWLMHWQLLAMHSPVTVQTLLYRLGYVERGDLGLENVIVSRYAVGKKSRPGHVRSSLKVGILGPRGAGKVSLICALAGVDQDVDSYQESEGLESASFSVGEGDSMQAPSPTAPYYMGDLPDTSEGRSSLQLHAMFAQAAESQMAPSPLPPAKFPSLASTSTIASKEGQRSEAGTMCLWKRRSLRTCVTGGRLVSFDGLAHLTSPVSIIATAIPELYAFAWMARHGTSCDAIMIVFEGGSLESFQSAIKFEEVVPESVPRFYVATKSDLGEHRGKTSAGNAMAVARVVDEYLAEHGLPPLLVVSSVTGEGMDVLLSSILDLSAQRGETGIPLGIRRKRESEAFNRTVFKVTLVVAAVVGIGALVFARARARG